MYRTTDDLLTHLRQMSPEDHRRVLRNAASLIPGTPWAEPRDLYNDAVESTYRGTRDSDGRRWRLDVPLVAHLIMTERGLVSDWRRDAFRLRTVPLDVDILAPSEEAALSTAALEEQLIHEEEHAMEEQQRTRACAALLSRFQDDDLVCQIIQKRLKGTPRRKIRQCLGVTPVQYASAERRLHRGLTALRKMPLKINMPAPAQEESPEARPK